MIEPSPEFWWLTQRMGDVPKHNHWLAPNERDVLAQLKTAISKSARPTAARPSPVSAVDRRRSPFRLVTVTVSGYAFLPSAG
jgi:hypothetical protein